MDKDQTEEQRELVFLRGVFQHLTHELAAPMTPLLGHLDLLESRSETELSVLQKRCMKAMRRSLRRLQAINDGMLELARVERGQIPCNPVAQGVTKLPNELRERFRKELQDRSIEWIVEDQLPSGCQVRIDHELTILALSHLVTNALRGSRDGQSITLRFTLTGSNVRMQVIDHGIGVAASEIEKITQPFFRIVAEDAYTETAGLGLTVVSLIASRQGGSLDFQGTNPNGTPPGFTAILTVPVNPS